MTAAIQRPLKGSRITTFYPVKDLPSLASLDSAFQLQEYISLLVRLNPHDVEAITSLPGSGKEPTSESTKGEEAEKVKSEVIVDQWCWIYEQLRRLAQDLTHPLITTLQGECTRASCPEMKAGEWLYLCVAHGNEGSMEQCCAIDYILHTLDSATALLNSPRAFPSRIQIPDASQRHFSSLARRLGRIFAHAYFHHREAFEQAEAESSLYSRFLALSSKFDLVSSEFLPIPPAPFYAQADDQDEERYPRNAPPPKLLAAGLEPQPLSEEDPERRQLGQQDQLKSLLQHPEERGPSSLHLEPPRHETASPNPPGLVPEASPRRSGRNRTDTMVFSEAEAQSFAEQLSSRSGASPERAADTNAVGQQIDEASPAPDALSKSFAEVVAEGAQESAPAEMDLVDLPEAQTSKGPESAAETKADEAPHGLDSNQGKTDEETKVIEETAQETQDHVTETKVEEDSKAESALADVAASQHESASAETAASNAEDLIPDSQTAAPATGIVSNGEGEERADETPMPSEEVSKEGLAPTASATEDSKDQETPEEAASS